MGTLKGMPKKLFVSISKRNRKTQLAKNRKIAYITQTTLSLDDTAEKDRLSLLSKKNIPN